MGEVGSGRWLAVHAAVDAVMLPLAPGLWLLTGRGYFWPAWWIGALTILLGSHSWFIFLDYVAREPPPAVAPAAPVGEPSGSRGGQRG